MTVILNKYISGIFTSSVNFIIWFLTLRNWQKRGNIGHVCLGVIYIYITFYCTIQTQDCIFIFNYVLCKYGQHI